MLNDFLEDYKKYIIIVLFFSIFYFFGNENTEEKLILKDDLTNLTDEYVKPTIYVEKVLEEKTYEGSEDIKVKEEENTNEIVEKEIQKILLLSRYTEDNRYFIQLVSKRELEIYEEKEGFLIITGVINDGYEESLFPMSVSENYLEDTSALILKIEDKKNNIKSICDGYFLDSLSKGFSYHIKIDFREDISECYVVHQSDFVDEDYSKEEKEYVEIKDGVMGQLSDKKIIFTDKKDLNKEKISF